MLVTDGGQLIRCPVEGIRIAGRATQGVIVFDTAEEERVVSVERIGEPEGGRGARKVEAGPGRVLTPSSWLGGVRLDLPIRSGGPRTFVACESVFKGLERNSDQPVSYPQALK